MQSAVSIDCCRDEILHIALIAHIGAHKNGFTALAFDRLYCFASSRIDITDKVIRALADK